MFTLYTLFSPRWENAIGADIICKKLGYKWGLSYTDPAGDYEERGEVFTNIRACKGTEGTTWDCPSETKNIDLDLTNACQNHAYDQGVSCFGKCLQIISLFTVQQ